MTFATTPHLVSPISGRTPRIIQGGMGVAVSSYELANAVAQTGEMGVVSGTALDVVLARRLQNGDFNGDIRRALAAFPDQEMAQNIQKTFYRENGRSDKPTYRPATKLSLVPAKKTWELLAVSAFVEVWLAKEGHEGLIGINLLEKIQLSTLGTLYGAMLAGVDAVLMGAGIPAEIPGALDKFQNNEEAALDIDVAGSTINYKMTFDPKTLGPILPAPLKRPFFIAIITTHVLAMHLSKNPATKPDGFVVERPDAGGHNAPPRGRVEYNEEGEPIYGARDEVDYEKLRAVGLPFWMAGGYSVPEKLLEAKDIGACGIQVGSLFAASNESGILRELKDELLADLLDSEFKVKTDAKASPTGFPFKVAAVQNTIAKQEVYEARPRLCDLGYLREPFEREPNTLSYRCSAEPVDAFLDKGGDISETVGRKCLCNGLLATVGMGQIRPDGYEEPVLVTFGSDLKGPRELIKIHPKGWSVQNVVDFLSSKV